LRSSIRLTSFTNLPRIGLLSDATSAGRPCPITQNGAIRILGHSSYPSGPGSPLLAARLLDEMLASEHHSFWPDDLSLLDDRLVDLTAILSPGRVTDT